MHGGTANLLSRVRPHCLLRGHCQIDNSMARILTFIRRLHVQPAGCTFVERPQRNLVQQQQQHCTSSSTCWDNWQTRTFTLLHGSMARPLTHLRDRRAKADEPANESVEHTMLASSMISMRMRSRSMRLRPPPPARPPAPLPSCVHRVCVCVCKVCACTACMRVGAGALLDGPAALTAPCLSQTAVLPLPLSAMYTRCLHADLVHTHIPLPTRHSR